MEASTVCPMPSGWPRENGDGTKRRNNGKTRNPKSWPNMQTKTRLRNCRNSSGFYIASCSFSEFAALYSAIIFQSMPTTSVSATFWSKSPTGSRSHARFAVYVRTASGRWLCCDGAISPVGCWDKGSLMSGEMREMLSGILTLVVAYQHTRAKWWTSYCAFLRIIWVLNQK